MFFYLGHIDILRLCSLTLTYCVNVWYDTMYFKRRGVVVIKFCHFVTVGVMGNLLSLLNDKGPVPRVDFYVDFESKEFRLLLSQKSGK